MTEVRLKLHAAVPNAGVQNIWMSLSYDKKPTIAHIINQLKANLNCDTDTVVNLYLDEYWLPPWENSRLLRENDCIRVELQEDMLSSKSNLTTSTSKNNVANTIPSTNYYEPLKQQLKEQIKINDKTNCIVKPNDLNLKLVNHQPQQKKLNNNNNKFLKNTMNESITSPTTSTKSSLSSSSSMQLPANTANKQQKPTNNKQQQQTVKNSSNNQTKAAASNNLNKNNNNNNTKPMSMAAHKKFSVANYVHLLSEEPTTNNLNKEDDNEKWDEYEDEEEEQPNEVKNAKKYNQTSSDNIERIAQTINATAKSKWKNSEPKHQQQQSNNGRTMPQHIRFESSTSSSSSDSDSSSDSSSESKSSENIKKATVAAAAAAKNQQKKQPVVNNNQKKKSPQKQQQPQNNWKPMNKEEQLNLVSYNRSFTVQNPKSVNEFKKVFNKSKLNAPVNGDEYDYDYNNEQEVAAVVERKPKFEKKKQEKKNAIDCEKFESFGTGLPKVDDKIAFQILEISSNFTPEISDYKAGIVLAFDEKTKEVTLKLDGSSYNEVLNKPNKFTIIRNRDEEEEENEDDNDNDSNKSKEDNREKSEDGENEDDRILVIDWPSLINVKKMTSEQKKETKPEEVKQIQTVENVQKVVVEEEEKNKVQEPEQQPQATQEQQQTQNV